MTLGFIPRSDWRFQCYQCDPTSILEQDRATVILGIGGKGAICIMHRWMTTLRTYGYTLDRLNVSLSSITSSISSIVLNVPLSPMCS